MSSSSPKFTSEDMERAQRAARARAEKLRRESDCGTLCAASVSNEAYMHMTLEDPDEIIKILAQKEKEECEGGVEPPAEDAPDPKFTSEDVERAKREAQVRAERHRRDSDCGTLCAASVSNDAYMHMTLDDPDEIIKILARREKEECEGQGEPAEAPAPPRQRISSTKLPRGTTQGDDAIKPSLSQTSRKSANGKLSRSTTQGDEGLSPHPRSSQTNASKSGDHDSTRCSSLEAEDLERQKIRQDAGVTLSRYEEHGASSLSGVRRPNYMATTSSEFSPPPASGEEEEKQEETVSSTVPTTDSKPARDSAASGQRPGAYSKAPGERMSRNQSLRFSVVNRDSVQSAIYDISVSSSDDDDEEGNETPDVRQSTCSAASEGNGTDLMSDESRAVQEMRKRLAHSVTASDASTQASVDIDASGYSRGQSVSFSAPDSVPEALDTVELGDNQITEDEEKPGTTTMSTTNSVNTPVGGSHAEPLIEAQLVTDKSSKHLAWTGESSRHLVFEATPVESAEIVLDFLKTPKGMAFIACILLSLLALILGLVLGIKGGDSSSIETQSPSYDPSMSPTLAPTVEFTLDLLPPETVAVIVGDRTSAQAQALEWAANDTVLQPLSMTEKLERFGLACFYYSTNGDQWADSSNWLSYEHHHCTWLDSSKQHPCELDLNMAGNLLRGTLPPEMALAAVASMDLRDNSLEGTIPSTIGLLSDSLTLIDMSHNQLSGEIPSEIGSLQQLKGLLLADNDLSGSIAVQVSQLDQLKSLLLRGNILEGPIPSELGKLNQLNILDLSSNIFSSTLPTEIASARELAQLSLHKNVLSGTLPSEIGSLQKLADLGLSDCRFSGNLPSELGLLTRMLTLGLAGTDLTGSLPTEVFNLIQLHEFNLANSRFSGPVREEIGKLTLLRLLELQNNDFSSTLPSELGLLESLRTLWAEHNSISGSIPSELFSISRLETLVLAANPLTGSLPSDIGFSSRLEVLKLGATHINGTLPSQVGLLSNLLSFEAFECGLSGKIPSEIGAWRRLETLLLHSNSLQGSIPSAIGSLAGLRRMEIFLNALSGTLPNEINGLGFLSHLDLNDNLLSGSIPSLGNLGQLTTLRLDWNQFEGLLPTELGRLGRLEILMLSGNANVSLPKTSMLPPNLLELHVAVVVLGGTIPNDIHLLSNLQYADFSFAYLRGTIPTTFGLLTALERLDVWTNYLLGNIPSELGLLSSLAYLDLEENFLVGPLPEELFLLPDLAELYIGENAGLSGTVPDFFCEQTIHATRIDCAEIECSCCDCWSSV